MNLQKNPAKISEFAPDTFWLDQVVRSLIYPASGFGVLDYGVIFLF